MRVCSLCLYVLLVGCAGRYELMPTPNLYTGESTYPAERVPEAWQKNRVDLLYLTDRMPVSSSTEEIEYGAKRSASVGFGKAIVEIGDGLTWPELVASSQTATRPQSIHLQMLSRTELGRFPPTPFPLVRDNGRIVNDPVVVQAQDTSAEIFRRVLQEQLAIAERKEVVMFVHGFNDSFDHAAKSHAEMWHFLGRIGVPILYSWPAAHGGLFGYFTDRESGEFTIFHLKQTIKLLASFPEVKRIHIIAHSRGTDVVTTALRELIIASRAAGLEPRDELRIENLVLAAPDLDFDVVRQRLMAEKFGAAFGQVSIYTNDADQALQLSETLMSGTRLGHMDASNLDTIDASIFSVVGNVHFISVDSARVKTSFGHDYFRSHPAASSDIIIALRKGIMPGESGRPLVHQQLNFWRIPRGYPRLVP